MCVCEGVCRDDCEKTLYWAVYTVYAYAFIPTYVYILCTKRTGEPFLSKWMSIVDGSSFLFTQKSGDSEAPPG